MFLLVFKVILFIIIEFISNNLKIENKAFLFGLPFAINCGEVLGSNSLIIE